MYLDLSTLKRGNIVWVDFGQPFGSEQGGVRCAIIVQNDIGNKFSPCTIVLPTTTSETKASIPTQREMIIDGKWNLVYGEQIRTIDKHRIIVKRGIVDTITDMESINRAIKVSLALN